MKPLIPILALALLSGCMQSPSHMEQLQTGLAVLQGLQQPQRPPKEALCAQSFVEMSPKDDDEALGLYLLCDGVRDMVDSVNEAKDTSEIP